MNKILEVITKNRILFKNILVVLVIAVCGVIYCIYGRKFIKDNYNSKEKTTDEYKINGGWEEIESLHNQTENIYVYICGAVVNPGVYTCQEGMRLYELIDKAGGFLEDADRNYLNLVEIVEDGRRVYVPSKSEMIAQGTYSGQRININTADKVTLMTLPGIGEARAEDIVAYRQTHGNFSKVEDIMKVNGIKEAAYEKIKDYIMV
ncbi:MAG: helix-hairpin-helix domain-containing protein [Lachnospira sp.]|nr:helix-hairpin-helix domain-containing protein [Lachnospira sp.]